MAKYNNSHVTLNTPRMGNAVTRAIGAFILFVLGWKVKGQLADEPKAVLIGAPHTSNIDFFLAMGSMLSVGLKFTWMMKKEGFFFPFKGMLKALGGVPIDRGSRTDIVSQMAEWFETQDIAWLGLTPEGTRSKVDQFKRGYLRIAYAAKVPVFLVVVDGKNKEVLLDKVWALTGDIERDNAAIKAYYDENYVGVRPEKS